MRRTVAIIGSAINALQAPRVGIERWGINGSFSKLAAAFGQNPDAFDAWDRWYDIHTRGHIQKHRPHALPWYRTRDASKPIVMLDHYPDIPASVPLPRLAVQGFYAQAHPEEFFTSSLDWMLAIAGMEGVDRVELYGVDLWAGKERATQRDGGHYWIGRLRGMGVEVHIPDESSMCKVERVYGPMTLNGARHFKSMNLERFVGQVHRAREMEQPGYVAPGVDEEPQVSI